jgi:H+/Cl- antiporter ClcA
MSDAQRRQSPIMLALNLMEWRGKFLAIALGTFFGGSLVILATMYNISDQLSAGNFPDHHWSLWPLLALALAGLLFAITAGFVVAAVVAHAMVAIMDLPLPPKSERALVKAEQVNRYGSGNR